MFNLFFHQINFFGTIITDLRELNTTSRSLYNEFQMLTTVELVEQNEIWFKLEILSRILRQEIWNKAFIINIGRNSPLNILKENTKSVIEGLLREKEQTKYRLEPYIVEARKIGIDKKKGLVDLEFFVCVRKDDQFLEKLQAWMIEGVAVV